MRAFFTFLLVVISVACYAQTHNQHTTQYKFKNDLKRQNIHGTVTEVSEKEYNGAGDSLIMTSVTKYDDKGNKASFFTYAPSGAVLSKTTFTYNDSDKLVEETRYKADGSLNVKTTCKYDDRGNKTEEYNYDATGTMFMKVLSKFDGKGNRIVKDSHNEFGALFLKCNSKFDEDGNEITAKEFDSHKSLKFSTTFDYDDFDKSGNWRKRTTYKNDEPFAVTIREIK